MCVISQALCLVFTYHEDALACQSETTTTTTGERTKQQRRTDVAHTQPRRNKNMNCVHTPNANNQMKVKMCVIMKYSQASVKHALVSLMETRNARHGK